MATEIANTARKIKDSDFDTIFCYIIIIFSNIYTTINYRKMKRICFIKKKTKIIFSLDKVF